MVMAPCNSVFTGEVLSVHLGHELKGQACDNPARAKVHWCCSQVGLQIKGMVLANLHLFKKVQELAIAHPDPSPWPGATENPAAQQAALQIGFG